MPAIQPTSRRRKHYDDEHAHLYEVTLRGLVEISPDAPLGEVELTAALIDNLLDYVRVIRAADGDERIARGETSLKFTHHFIEEHRL